MTEIDDNSVQHEKRSIVFFDGVCGLCSASVDVLMKIDKKHILKFAPLQGQTSEHYSIHRGNEPPETIKLLHKGIVYEKSDAILTLLTVLGMPYSLLRIFVFVPKSLRDSLYVFIASRRYSWFGKKESCRLPTAEERSYFLP